MLDTEDGSLDFSDEPEVLSHLSDVTDADSYKHALQRILERVKEIDYFDLNDTETFVLETAQGVLGE